MSAVFETIAFEGDLDAFLKRLPSARGVAQILGESGDSLLVGRATSLKRWAATQLGRAKPPKNPKPLRRPRTDLTSLVRQIRFARTTSPFHERLVFERLVAPLVPLSKRKDLRPPAWVWISSERFPRLTVRPEPGPSGFGPFRDAKTATRARESLEKRLGLRPCDFSFEPDPALPLGLRCVYAQVRTCSAPCLTRVDERDYQQRALAAAAAMTFPPADEWVPPHVGPSLGAAVVLERTQDAVELYPVLAQRVLEQGAVRGRQQDSPESLAERLTWPLESAVAGASAGSATPRRVADDSAWLSSWLSEKKRSGRFVPLPPGPGALHASSVAAALAPLLLE